MARAPRAVGPVRRAVTIVAVLVVLGLVLAAGTLLGPQQPDARQVVTVAAGQADAVCAVGTVSAVGASASASPSPGAVPSASSAPSPSSPGVPGTSDPSVTPFPAPSATPAVPSGSPTPSLGTTPPAPETSPSATPGRVTVVASGPTDTGTVAPTGRVTLGLLGQAGADPAGVSVDRQGRGATLERAAAPVLLRADGTLAPTAVGAVVSRSADGPEAGLEAAPCLVPSTSAWLPGVASGVADRTELVLSNPDDAEATVDLTFYGRNGRVAVPGSPGVEVPPGSSRSVSLSGLVDADGPLTVSVQATTGRVAAAARRIRTAGDVPAGADWVVPATVPGTRLVVPAVPGDEGTRELVVTNPGELRATVSVSVLGLQGPFAPAGAETIELGPQSSGTLALAEGLAGTGSGVALTSDQPVTGAVVSTSARSDAQPDIAVQAAAPALVRTGVSAVATTRETDAELVVSNAATTDVTVHFSVRSLQGVELRTGDILVAAGGSATRRLASPAPSYVVVQVPDGSSVTGGVDLVEAEGDVAGLASLPLVSPDTSGPPPVVEQDPVAGR